MVISYFSGKNVWWQVFYLCQFVLDTAENCEQLQNVPKNLKCQHQFLLHAKFITVLNVVTARKCFHGCLSFCPRGGVIWQTSPLGRHPLWADTPRPDTPRTRADTPLPSKRLLQRTAVRLLLECILVIHVPFLPSATFFLKLLL